MKRIHMNESKYKKLSNVVYDKSNSINESVSEKPTDEEYYWAKQNIYLADNIENYDYCKDIIDRYEADDNIYHKLLGLSIKQKSEGLGVNSEYLLTNGKVVGIHYHNSVSEIGYNKSEFLKMGNIRIIGDYYDSQLQMEMSKYPNEIQERKLLKYISTCDGEVYVDITEDGVNKKHFCFDRKTFSPELILKKLKEYFSIKTESVKKYITVLKEEFALDGSSNSNPYKKRWETERKVLKDFICNNGVVMQSKEDNKQGKLYKCFTDTWLSNLIGYNYCLCVQWDEIKMKPKSVVYIRALDKFTPNIRRNIQFDNRGFDNLRNTYDDVRNYSI